jgi:hypothetical protein
MNQLLSNAEANHFWTQPEFWLICGGVLIVILFLGITFNLILGKKQ